jgi:hypothetical protein
VDPRAIIERLWPGEGEAVAVEPLGGGITNHNFKVTPADGHAVVLRVGGKDTELLGIDRSVEEAASRMAAAIGVGPDVAGVVRPEGYLVTRFIEAEPIPTDRMRDLDMIMRVAATSAPSTRARPSPAGSTPTGWSRPTERPRCPGRRHPGGVRQGAGGVELDRTGSWPSAARALPQRLPERELPAGRGRCRPRGRLGVRGDGRSLLRPGELSVNHGFESAHDLVLLAAYSGGRARDVDLASLRLMRFMSDFREAMWGVLQQGISELDFDFVTYADEHFDRLRATAADPRFEGWLTTAAEARDDG